MDFLKKIECQRRIYTSKYQTHSHAYGQLILPLHGSMNIKTSSFDYEVDDTHLFYIPPNCVHTFYSNNINEFLVIDIPLEVFNGLGINKYGKELYQILDDRWKAIRYLILEEINYKAYGGSLVDLIKYMTSVLFQNNIPTSIQYINDNYSQQLTVENLAAMEHFNVSYYCQWFFNQTGMTPNEYIQNLRLEKAKILLQETELSLLEISQIVGYSHQSSLSRLFQKKEGLSPGYFRKMRR